MGLNMSVVPKSVVSDNKVVSLAYIVRNEEGDVLDYRDLPISYLQGVDSEMFPKIERALAGRRVGDKVQVKLSAEEAFGQRDPGLTFIEDMENIPEEFRELGAEFEAEGDNGEVLQFQVTDIFDGKLTIDANHPLSGQNLEFDITITGVREPTTEELIDAHLDEDTPQTIQ